MSRWCVLQSPPIVIAVVIDIVIDIVIAAVIAVVIAVVIDIVIYTCAAIYIVWYRVLLVGNGGVV